MGDADSILGGMEDIRNTRVKEDDRRIFFGELPTLSAGVRERPAYTTTSSEVYYAKTTAFYTTHGLYALLAPNPQLPPSGFTSPSAETLTEAGKEGWSHVGTVEIGAKFNLEQLMWPIDCTLLPAISRSSEPPGICPFTALYLDHATL
jgi:hypothetical protein